MCGIVAYIGNKKCKDILIDGLKRLEYRGYDSAGIAIIPDNSSKKEDFKNSKINVVKEAGKIKILKKEISNLDVNGNCGIGHTR